MRAMKELPSPKNAALRKIGRLRRKGNPHNTHAVSASQHDAGSEQPDLFDRKHEIKVICLYPSVVAGKLSRQWLESAMHAMAPHAPFSVEYFNYAVLSQEGISWEHVIGRNRPDIILIVGDGKQTLNFGLRHSLRGLLSHTNGSKKKPMVIFRDLEPEPTLNTRVLLDYVSALTLRNHCELNAMNGNGHPISCFRHPRHLLKTRKYYE